MKQLINVITKYILDQVKPQKSNLVRIEGIDNPIVYTCVCEKLKQSELIQLFIPKLAKEKYQEFVDVHDPTWLQAINFLYQGDNSYYASIPNNDYLQASYVDFNNAITKWRNESANLGINQTSLILLMGTEVASDTGGLIDTSFVISPKEIIAALKADYSSWFVDVLNENSICSSDCRRAIHTLYRSIFVSINIDLFKLSGFVDELHEMQFTSAQELVSYICETLNEVWGIPCIIDNKAVPQVQNLSRGNLSSAKIITSAMKFIERADDIPSASYFDKLRKKFAKYAEEKNIDVSSAFPEDSRLFDNYSSFENCVIDFMSGKDLETNRSLLLQIDYAIIDKIIGTKLIRETSEKAPLITGEPVEAYAKIFLKVASQFHNDYSTYPTSVQIRVDKIFLSDCIDDQKEDSYMQVCNFLGGILRFFNDSSIESNGELLTFKYDSETLDPFDFANYDEIKYKVKSTGKWGDPCKVQFTIRGRGGAAMSCG
jgi:hypothetical protein